MSILSARNVHGVVPYIDAWEIPAFAVMEFVEGCNLTEAVRMHVLDDWPNVLRIAADLAGIIRKSHRLPERVLHRDIRPSNVMLRNCWPQCDFKDIEVVVLDFDLSWHRDAIETSIVNASTMNGYLAPEQVYRNDKVSTRNAAVDSFGLGMTLLYLRTGKEPAFAQHRHSAWEDNLRQWATHYVCPEWRSLPNRYFRLIKNATLDEQSNRWDMSTIEGEITRLQDAFHNPAGVHSAELIAEEMAARGLITGYRWDADHATAKASIGGTHLEVRAIESSQTIEVDIRSNQTVKQVKDIRRGLPRLRTRIDSAFRKHHWHVQPT
jgi:serine/threonine protein kinase